MGCVSQIVFKIGQPLLSHSACLDKSCFLLYFLTCPLDGLSVTDTHLRLITLVRLLFLLTSCTSSIIATCVSAVCVSPVSVSQDLSCLCVVAILALVYGISWPLVDHVCYLLADEANLLLTYLYDTAVLGSYAFFFLLTDSNNSVINK